MKPLPPGPLMEAIAKLSPEKVLCIDDGNLDAPPGFAPVIWPNGPIVKGRVYHVTDSGIFDAYGNLAYRLLGFPAVCCGLDVGWNALKFRKLR